MPAEAPYSGVTGQPAAPDGDAPGPCPQLQIGVGGGAAMGGWHDEMMCSSRDSGLQVAHFLRIVAAVRTASGRNTAVRACRCSPKRVAHYEERYVLLFCTLQDPVRLLHGTKCCRYVSDDWQGWGHQNARYDAEFPSSERLTSCAAFTPSATECHISKGAGPATATTPCGNILFTMSTMSHSPTKAHSSASSGPVQHRRQAAPLTISTISRSATTTSLP